MRINSDTIEVRNASAVNTVPCEETTQFGQLMIFFQYLEQTSHGTLKSSLLYLRLEHSCKSLGFSTDHV